MTTALARCSTAGLGEWRGAYNRHAGLQAAGGTLALNALKQAAAGVVLETADQPIVIAEYGASQGRNSQLPMRVAITGLRARVGPDRPVLVYHEDLPINDFGSLFEVLESDPDRYVRDDPHVYPCAIGRSFYESVLPPAGLLVALYSTAYATFQRLLTCRHAFAETSRRYGPRRTAAAWDRA